MKTTLLIIAITVIISLLVGIVVGIRINKKNVTSKLSNLKWYKDNYLRKQGFSVGFGNYHLMSFDSGKNWYAIKRDSEGVHILGKSEEIFPGLLAQLNGFEKLTEYIIKNGPISDLNEDMTVLLNDAGFTVGRVK